jgi:transcriptional regulator with XRE-family HTH domain
MDAKQLQRRFGRLVAAHRRRVGKTQEELAADAGVSVDMITRIEGGGTGVRFPNITKIAAALNVDPAELFTGELPSGALARGPLMNLMAQLAKLSERDFQWVEGLVQAALKNR